MNFTSLSLTPGQWFSLKPAGLGGVLMNVGSAPTSVVTVDPSTGLGVTPLDTSGLVVNAASGEVVQPQSNAGLVVNSAGTVIGSLDTSGLTVDASTGVSIGADQVGWIKAALLANSFASVSFEDLFRGATLGELDVDGGVTTVGQAETALAGCTLSLLG